jgi:putative tricarboxylic transport membrane protein
VTWKPARELEIVAGTPPGGGLDRSARALMKSIMANALVDVPVRVVNVGGDGGRNAWRHIECCAGDGHVIGISSPNMAADYLTGVTRSDPDRFAPLAILYSEYIAFVVRADSAIRDGADLIRRFAANTVTVALSTSLGNSNHVAVAKVIRHGGGDTRAPKIRVFDTALDAVADVVAGHADMGAITAASAVPELQARQLRAVATSSPARLPGPYAAAPTWSEQGLIASSPPGGVQAGRPPSAARKSRFGRPPLRPPPAPRNGSPTQLLKSLHFLPKSERTNSPVATKAHAQKRAVPASRSDFPIEQLGVATLSGEAPLPEHLRGISAKISIAWSPS